MRPGCSSASTREQTSSSTMSRGNGCAVSMRSLMPKAVIIFNRPREQKSTQFLSRGRAAATSLRPQITEAVSIIKSKIINRDPDHRSPFLARISKHPHRSLNHQSSIPHRSLNHQSSIPHRSLHTSQHHLQSLSQPHLEKMSRKRAVTGSEIAILEGFLRLIWHENDRRRGKVAAASMRSEFPSRDLAIARF